MNQRYNSNNKRQSLLFSSCALVDGDMYSVTSLKGVPIKISLKTGEISYIDNLIENDYMMTEDIISGNNEIFILEQSGHRMLRVDLKRGLNKFYEISCHEKDWGNYAAYVKYNETIYIFPRYTNYIVKIDLETDLVKQDFDLYREMKEDSIRFWCGCCSGDKVWLFQKDKREVVEYDLETESWIKYVLPLRIISCRHIVKERDVFYILSSEGKVYIWNFKEGDMKVLADCSGETKEFAFSRIVVTEKNISVLPAMTNDIYQIDKKSGDKRVYHDYPEHFEYCAPEIWTKYSGYCEDENYYYFAMRSSTFILCINKKNGELKWLTTLLPSNREYRRVYYKIHYKADQILDEREWSLIEVLDYVEKKNENNRKCKIGKQIWNKMRDV